MTKAKTTKRALLMSVLSMMLCMAMLVGSTFAWFTDSVTSGKNKIVAGNLDVELFHTNSNVTAEEKVGTDTMLFKNKDGSDVLWEPGVMVYENFTVKNVGSLALKYKLTLNAECNTVDGKSLKDVLKVAILDKAFSGDRAAAQDLTFNKTVSDFEKPGNIAANAAGDTYAVVIYWEPSDKDNDYNFNNDRKNLEKLYIDLGVTLVATQNTVESDSFNNDYDKDALYQWDDDSTVRIGNTFYKTLKEAVDAAQDNDTIMLYNGTLSDKDSVSVNKNLTIIGTGNKESELNGVQLYVGNNVKLTLKNIHFTGKSAVLTDQTGNNEISINDCLIEAAFKHSAYGRAAFILGRHQSQATKLTITNNTFLRYAADDLHAMAIFTWNAIQSDSVIQGNTFGSKDDQFTFGAIKIINSADDGGLISLCDNEFYGTNDCWVVQLALQHDYNIKFLFKDNAFNGGGMAIDLDPQNGAGKYTKTEVYISDGNTYDGSPLTTERVENYPGCYSDNSINWGDPT